MNTADSAIADQIITNSINLFRLTAGEQRKAIRLIEQMKKELIGKLANDNLTEFGKARIKKLLSETTVIIRDYYIDINSGIDESLASLANYEAGMTAKAMVAVSIDAAMPSSNAIQSIISDLLIQGAPSKDWWAAQSANTAFKFANEVRQGLAQNETNAQIIKRIGPIMDTSKRGAAALVHTSVQTVANNSRLATFRANADVLKGVEQLSTLDGHTTDICIAYSGAQWDLDGMPLNGTTLTFNGGPPRHWNCRSVLVPITKSFRELGLNIDEIPAGQRASDEGPISANITFDKFLDGKTKTFQDDLLGKGRADLWRSGKITLRDLVNQQGRPLTLEQLKAKYQ